MPLLGFTVAAAFYSWGFVLRVSPSVMTSELMRDFAVGAGALGQLSALYYYAYAVMQVPVGVLLDRIGPRRLLTGAVLTAGTGAALFALAENLVVASIGRTLIGIGCSFSFVGVLTVIGRTFPARLFARLGGVAQFCGVGGSVWDRHRSACW
jgi:MFS family permease